MTDNLYEVQIKNVPFLQAQALYRFLVDLNDEAQMSGTIVGETWSGPIDVGTGMRRPEARTVIIRPMPTHEEIKHELEELTSIYLDCKNSLDRVLEELANARNSITERYNKSL